MQSQPKSEKLLPGEVRGCWRIPDFVCLGLPREAAVVEADGATVSPALSLASEAEFGVGRPQVPPQPLDSCYHPG
jgi:hypothetical protein